jgi:hypothetical protein
LGLSFWALGGSLDSGCEAWFFSGGVNAGSVVVDSLPEQQRKNAHETNAICTMAVLIRPPSIKNGQISVIRLRVKKNEKWLITKK